MTIPHIFRSRLVLISLTLLATVGFIFAVSPSMHILQGNLTDDRVLVLADTTPKDGSMSAKEMRKVISGMIRAIATHDLTYDLNRSGVTDRMDLKLLIQSMRLYLNAVCGNSRKEFDEQCDDGNQDNDDSCSNLCKRPVCGDGVRQGSSEACDDGNTINDDACSNRCSLPFCGDGIPQISNDEQCDDGNQISTDDCTIACKKPVCGDQIVWIGHEQCDGNDVGKPACNDDCEKIVCGDGIKDSHETCDDGNQVNDDACTNACATPRCGDGIVQEGEQCDPMSTPYTCSNACTIPICGNGVREALEKCDDGNIADGDGCSSACAFEPSYSCTNEQPNRCYLCGNSIVEPGEACDDGNTINDDACSNRCGRNPTCGDGIKEGTEQCDDHNIQNGDRCSAECVYEDPQHTADLSVKFGFSRSGDELVFGMVVTNDGPASASYKVSMPVPPGWTLFLPESTPGGYIQNGVFIYDSKGSVISPGQSIVEWAAFDHHSIACGGPRATVETDLYDPNLQNNTSEIVSGC